MPLYRGLYPHSTCTITSLLHNLSCHPKTEFTINYLIFHIVATRSRSLYYIYRLTLDSRPIKQTLTIWSFLLLHPTGIKTLFTTILKMSPKGRKPVKRWSMFPSLHGDVASLLLEDSLIFEFYNVDSDDGCTNDRDTNIMGRFICDNPRCNSNGWPSNKIAITIRMYPGLKYNARVYKQRCRICKNLGRPVLDRSYTERVTYWIKKWNGVEVERPLVSTVRRGPHNSQLCEGCQNGHCSELRDDWITQMER